SNGSIASQRGSGIIISQQAGQGSAEGKASAVGPGASGLLAAAEDGADLPVVQPLVLAQDRRRALLFRQARQGGADRRTEFGVPGLAGRFLFRLRRQSLTGAAGDLPPP